MLALVLAAAFTFAAPQEMTLTASDGVQLSCALVEPDGGAPAGGWPAVMLFHGLGKSHVEMEPLATQFLAPAGYASLMCDARGQGTSGGNFGLDGPRDVQDTRDLFTWLAARPEISDTAIGALGFSLGGGEVWNATVAGVPFKAIVPIITWTNLATSLAPNGLSKSGLIDLLALEIPTSRWDPDLLAAEPALLASSNLATFNTLAAARSPVASLASITTPTLLIQGRHDFLFDIDQAEAAYNALGGPKQLYIGDLGHPPATNPTAELPAIYGRALEWFDRYLKGIAGTPRPGVELAHDPWDGKTTTYSALPQTKKISVALPGTTTLRNIASVARGARLTGGAHETFGDGTVTVRYTNGKSWDRLVAVVTVAGQSSPVTEGGAKITAANGVATIHLFNEAVVIPAGKKVTVTLAPTSDSYSTGVPKGASITIGRETLALSVLTRAVSHP
ncbi:MAG TPA: CocE/NonD family hydrolase [Gaiellaceae bacterium]|nr:CocE/NonD family hydrolase [Gaiellaceae bacterium]